MKRMFLWIMTNMAIILVITVILQITGLNKYLTGRGGYLGLFIACAVIGFVGSFISLLLSKTMAIRGLGVQVITNPSNNQERWLIETVRRQADMAGIGMPDVGIFDSADPNAFATGANRNSALVAVSVGLLRQMNNDEVEAVLGHEIAHVANGDMVTLTLLQGVINTFVMFFARIIASRVASDSNGNINHGLFFIITLVLQILFGFLASMITSAFSRHREFRADEGGARFASSAKMIAALEVLQRQQQPEDLPDGLAAFGISGKMSSLFSSHPPLEKRIAALKSQQHF